MNSIRGGERGIDDSGERTDGILLYGSVSNVVGHYTRPRREVRGTPDPCPAGWDIIRFMLRGYRLRKRPRFTIRKLHEG